MSFKTISSGQSCGGCSLCYVFDTFSKSYFIPKTEADDATSTWRVDATLGELSVHSCCKSLSVPDPVESMVIDSKVDVKSPTRDLHGDEHDGMRQGDHGLMAVNLKPSRRVTNVAVLGPISEATCFPWDDDAPDDQDATTHGSNQMLYLLCSWLREESDARRHKP